MYVYMYLYSEIVIRFAFNLNENVTFFLLACTQPFVARLPGRSKVIEWLPGADWTLGLGYSICLLQSCVTELEGQRTKQPQPFVTGLFWSFKRQAHVWNLHCISEYIAEVFNCNFTAKWRRLCIDLLCYLRRLNLKSQQEEAHKYLLYRFIEMYIYIYICTQKL